MIRKSVLIIFSFFLILAFQNCENSGFGVNSPPVADSVSSGLPQDDPLFPYAWHLDNTGQKVFSNKAGVAGSDLNLKNTWAAGHYGKGVKVLVSDDGVEHTHEDLFGNFLTNNESRDYYIKNWAADFASPSDFDNHGTSVAGLIASIGGNGLGSSGVAPKTSIIATNFMSDEVPKTADIIADQVKGEVDIVNMSWGFPHSGYNPMEPTFEAQMKVGTSQGRSGKGTVYIKSSGNSRVVEVSRGVNDYRLGFSVFDDFNNTPYTILVGAYLATGIVTNYSSPGANLWVSSAGGYDGTKSPAMVTTDRKGCVLGYANSKVDEATKALGSGFQIGKNGNGNCDYTVQFNGTSSAAPTMAGAAALILGAYPQLTWRDVKYIVAKTATESTLDFDPVDNFLYSVNPTTYLSQKSPPGYQWDDAWLTNAAGFRFSNYYGFGKLNVDRAMDFASKYTSVFLSPLSESSQSVTGLALAIPDFSAAGVTSSIAVTQDMTIEAIQITPEITHGNIGELAVELVSPRGLRSVVIPMNNSLDKIANLNSSRLLTNAFYQESSVGTWTLRVVDGRTGTTGTLTGWKINIMGQLKN